MQFTSITVQSNYMRIPMISTTCSERCRPPNPIDVDHLIQNMATSQAEQSDAGHLGGHHTLTTVAYAMVSKFFALILLSTVIDKHCVPGDRGWRRPGLGQEACRASLLSGSEWRPG